MKIAEKKNLLLGGGRNRGVMGVFSQRMRMRRTENLAVGGRGGGGWGVFGEVLVLGAIAGSWYQSRRSLSGQRCALILSPLLLSYLPYVLLASPPHQSMSSPH